MQASFAQLQACWRKLLTVPVFVEGASLHHHFSIDLSKTNQNKSSHSKR
jgi:hypothetical protein